MGQRLKSLTMQRLKSFGNFQLVTDGDALFIEVYFLKYIPSMESPSPSVTMSPVVTQADILFVNPSDQEQTAEARLSPPKPLLLSSNPTTRRKPPTNGGPRHEHRSRLFRNSCPRLRAQGFRQR
jgi:hypothetical protein